MASTRDLMETARLRVWNKHPYIGAVLMSLRMVEKPIGTLAVDAGWRMYYDPAKVQEWQGDLLAGVVAHEVWHVLRDHFGRRGERNHKLWNIANDLEINSDITKAGWKLPEGVLLPKNFGLADGLLAEEYYDLLVQQMDQNKSGKGIPIPGMGEGEENSGTIGSGNCGSCAGNPHECEKGNHGDGDDKGDDGEGSGTGPINSWEQEVIRRQAAQDIAQAAKGQGNMPAGLKAWAEKYLQPPTIDWRKQLAGLVRKTLTSAAGAVDHTFLKVSKKGIGIRRCLGRKGPILPALHRPLPDVGVILDVSGSMMDGPAEAARSEIMGIVKAMGCPTTVYVADTQIADTVKIRRAEDIGKLGETLGGTDMSAAITEVDGKSRHNLLVVLTDGLTGWHAPGSIKAKLLAAITPGGTPPPEFITHVMMKKD